MQKSIEILTQFEDLVNKLYEDFMSYQESRLELLKYPELLEYIIEKFQKFTKFSLRFNRKKVYKINYNPEVCYTHNICNRSNYFNYLIDLYSYIQYDIIETKKSNDEAMRFGRIFKLRPICNDCFYKVLTFLGSDVVNFKKSEYLINILKTMKNYRKISLEDYEHYDIIDGVYEIHTHKIDMFYKFYENFDHIFQIAFDYYHPKIYRVKRPFSK